MSKQKEVVTLYIHQYSNGDTRSLTPKSRYTIAEVECYETPLQYRVVNKDDRILGVDHIDKSQMYQVLYKFSSRFYVSISKDSANVFKKALQFAEEKAISELNRKLRYHKDNITRIDKAFEKGGFINE